MVAKVLSYVRTDGLKCPACRETDNAQVVRDVPHGKVITTDEKIATINIGISGPYNDAPSNFRCFLLVVDEYSRWPEVFALPSRQAEQIVMSSKDYFARFGVPELFRCDEGSSFTNTKFTLFIIQSNVERFNQTIRKLLQTTFEDSRCWYGLLKSVLQTY